MSLRDTPNGYNFYHVASALQKCVRRGIEYDAYWWAHELVINNQATMVWNRLEVIACEDVGMGNPNAISIVHSCREAWERVNAKKDIEHLEWNILAHAVIVLCRSQKTRSADDLSHIVWLRKTGRDPASLCEVGNPVENLKIPQYAMDMHTASGKKRLAIEAQNLGVDPEEYKVKNFREVSARLDKPVKDLANDGTNWTEEVCKLQEVNIETALSPAEPEGSHE